MVIGAVDALTGTFLLPCPTHGTAGVRLSAFRQIERLGGAAHPAVYRVTFQCGCGDEHVALIGHDVLAPGGELFVQTDVWDIALDALSAFEPLFENQAGEWTFWKSGNPYGVRSWREQNAEETGLPVWRLLYRRQRSRNAVAL